MTLFGKADAAKVVDVTESFPTRKSTWLSFHGCRGMAGLCFVKNHVRRPNKGPGEWHYIGRRARGQKGPAEGPNKSPREGRTRTQGSPPGLKGRANEGTREAPNKVKWAGPNKCPGEGPNKGPSARPKGRAQQGPKWRAHQWPKGRAQQLTKGRGQGRGPR